ncbi:hypothetical protein LXA43DRAFT_1101210 [Ganoderma leucocontextum]|nr:hypothetical protein LXA43DRAFT_1101210 [Ganoderma leucocontextum]
MLFEFPLLALVLVTLLRCFLGPLCCITPLICNDGSKEDVALMLMFDARYATGMRTLCPEFSCNGNTCIIVAAPAQRFHRAPPGWFALWILECPTPSHSSCVRLGGDPGGLGTTGLTSPTSPSGMDPPARLTAFVCTHRHGPAPFFLSWFA